MQCPVCEADNPPTADHCTKCSTPLPLADVTISPTALEATAVGRTEAWSVAVTPRPSSEAASKGQLEPGTLLADRFEVIQLLGQGGMGAVYKGRDIELDRLVALKLIRPDLASHPEILRRFKQELILAREVTHRNVIRIFDLGQAQGIKFITMEYVEGRDLRSLIHEKTKLTAEEAVPIVLQIAAALEAAHHAGVVHRDLKPQNVLLDKDDRVYVMDFGIARSLETPGMTQTGALMGTPEYMSPEQAKGEKVDARSDLFALGIIFYEMLTGVSPFKADTAMAMMFKRIQERATPLAQLNIGVPGAISDIAAKCLEIKSDERYQTARDVINDLEAWKGGAPRSTIAPPRRHVRYASLYEKLLAGAAVVVLGLTAFSLREKFMSHPSTPVVTQSLVPSLAVLPFRNSSTDVSLDWIGTSLAHMLSTDVGQSSRLRTLSSDRVSEILTDQHIPANADFNADMARQFADSASAEYLVWGRYAKVDDKIRIDLTVDDVKRGRRTPLDIMAASENDIPGMVDRLADLIRTNLGLRSSEVQELKAAAYKPTSDSMEAVRDFTKGLELAHQGNQIEAVKQFEGATKADPNFALAYSWLGQTYSRLGYDQQAEQAGSKSVELSTNLNPVEKYMIEASNARIGNNYNKALEAYDKLAALMPNDPQIQFAMGELYEKVGTYDKAQEHYQKSLAGDPRQLDALRGMGEVESEMGKPEKATDDLNKALSIAVKLDNKQGKAIVEQDLGEAYKLLNRPQDALQNFQQSLDIMQQIGDKKGMAESLDQIAVVYYDSLGKSGEAEKTYKQELAIRKDLGDQAGLGVALRDFGYFLASNGRNEEALTTTKQSLQIWLQLGNEPNQVRCLGNIGEIYRAMAKYDDALMYHQRAVDLLHKLPMPAELAGELNNVGLSYFMIGQFDQAQSSYDQALEQARKIGNKQMMAAVSDGMAELFAVQGRLGAALNAQQDALRSAQQMEQQLGTGTAEIQADYASILSQLGRGQEAQKVLEESLATARSAQDDALVAKVLNFQGEAAYYRGDLKSAGPLFEGARQSAAKAKERIESLSARLNLARVSINEGHGAAAVNILRSLGKEAVSLNVKYISTKCTAALGEALLQTKDYSQAQDELQSAVRKSEDLGMKSLLPEGHYFLSQVLRKRGNNAEADHHLQQARELLEQMRQESKSDSLLERADLKPIVEDTRK